ncbi:MAG: glyoxylate/hydroxypyruvate reductase A [Saprospiraceae bacterium]
MSILLICNNKDPKPWAKALKAKLPDTSIEIYPAVSDPAAVDYLICWKPQPDTFRQFPNLKVIQSLGAGVEHITRTNTIDHSQLLTRIVDPNLAIDMWEFLLALVMNNLKQLPLYAQQQMQKKWQQHSYRTIKETTITVLGLGQIGTLVAENFARLGFEVLGWSNSAKAIPGVQSYVGLAELPECLSKTAILINILPLTDRTEGILNKSKLQHLPQGAFLINVGRGDHLIESDLIQLLDNDHLSGAFLDVFSAEPLPQEHPFWCHPKISVTPHIASLTNVQSAVEQLVENYQRFKTGRALLHQVSLEKGY